MLSRGSTRPSRPPTFIRSGPETEISVQPSSDLSRGQFACRRCFFVVHNRLWWLRRQHTTVPHPRGQFPGSLVRVERALPFLAYVLEKSVSLLRHATDCSIGRRCTHTASPQGRVCSAATRSRVRKKSSAKGASPTRPNLPRRHRRRWRRAVASVRSPSRSSPGSSASTSERSEI